ncbi:MAG: alpha/beta hydrolase [Candidatus Thorarchaeota archaeon]|jgi:pimeloyl-ACP methyl ester carboxylesterase
MPSFEHNGIKIHYVDVDKREDRTTGIPLVFVHGAGSSHLIWALQLREFSKEHRTIALDLSGHGKSEDIKGAPSIELNYAEELASLIRHLNLDRFILVGHSMGGGVVMSYFLKENVQKPLALVLVSTSCDLDLSKFRAGLVKETIEDRVYFFKSRIFENYTAAYQVKKLDDEMRLANPLVMTRDLNACREFNISERCGMIDVPVFVLVGSNDDIITPAIAADFEKKLPRADIAVVKEADHIPMVEREEEFNRLFRKFVNWVCENC